MTYNVCDGTLNLSPSVFKVRGQKSRL